MALITVTGEPGCRFEEVARTAAQRLRFEWINETQFRGLSVQEFGEGAVLPDKAHRLVVASLLAHLATEHHLVTSVMGAEVLARNFPGSLRVLVVAPENRKIGSLMIDRRLDRTQAKAVLADLTAHWKAERRSKVGRIALRPQDFDIVLNSDTLDAPQMADVIADAAERLRLAEQGLLSNASEAHLQFQLRLELSRHGITPTSRATLKRAIFSHPSEQIFANLLDFYRIGWEYEPRSFPIQWAKDGKVLEAFTPDFYLPEFDLYVELTTMKQAHVTRKNRKVKLLRTIYPQINIQVFYQKDLQNLIFKYGLADRVLQS
jgi:cytidylate kinase